MNELFLDTSYAIALSAETDSLHPKAKALAQRLKAESAKIITTRAVVLEIGNALAKARYRHAAGTLLRAFERDPRVEIIEVGPDLYAAALDLYCDRADKEWSLTDWLSFVIMRGRGLTDALTADTHFRQAGFRTLLHDD